MNTKEKRKNQPRRIYFFLLPAFFVVLSASLTIFFLRNSDIQPDIVFLHENEDGFTQLYGLNLDTDNLQTAEAIALTTPDSLLSYITSFDTHGDWILYAQSEDPNRLPEPIQSELMLLDWKSGEKHLLLDCDASGINCIDSILRFNVDGGTIFFQDTITWPPTVWMLDSDGSEPEIFAQYDSISTIEWLSENSFLYHYRDDNHNSHEILYNIDTRSLTDITDILYYELLGRIIAVSPDNQSIFSYISVTSAEYMGQEARPAINRYNLSTHAQEIYQIPETSALFAGDYGGTLVPFYWYPDQSAFLFSSSLGGLFKFDMATETIQSIWSFEEQITNIRWNADATQIVFVLGAAWHTPGELWLYDMETQEALPLPVLGYEVQWLD